MDSVLSNPVGTKKRREIIYDGDDDDDIREIFPDNKQPLEKSGSLISSLQISVLL